MQLFKRYTPAYFTFHDDTEFGKDGWEHVRDAMDEGLLPEQVMAFIKERSWLRGRKPSLNLFNMALADFLIIEKENLTRNTRLYIAGLLYRLYFPEDYSIWQKSSFASSVQELKDFLRDYARLPAEKAEKEIAEGLGITVDALRKRLQRQHQATNHRKSLRTNRT
jgi:hypothetical protein